MSVARKAKVPGRKGKRSRILVLAVLVFAVYVVVMLAQLQMELNEREEALADIDKRISEQQRTNEDLQDKLDNSETYLEEQARLRGLARPGELVFQEIPGLDFTES